MNVEEIIRELEKGYTPTWDPSLSGSELAELVREVSHLETGSKDYYRLKAEILRNIGRNGIEEYMRAKTGQGMVTRIIYDELDAYFLGRERDGGIIE